MPKKVINISPTSTVLFISSTKDEYLQSSIRLLTDLKQIGCKLSWKFIQNNEPTATDDPVYNYVKSCINKKLDPDYVIFHCDPLEWEWFLKKFPHFKKNAVVGFPILDFNKLPVETLASFDCVNVVWTCSEFDKRILEKGGVSVPIFPKKYSPIKFITLDKNFKNVKRAFSCGTWYKSDTSNLIRYGSDFKIFYTDGEWSKNNIDDIVISFCKTFEQCDNVKLILQTYNIDYTNTNRQICKSKLKQLLSKYPNHPDILLITTPISYTESSFLYSLSNCYFSLNKKSSLNLKAYDFINNGKDVIVIGYGNQQEYFGKSCSKLVDYELVHATGFDRSFKWAEPDILSVTKCLKSIYLSQLPTTFSNSIVFSNGWYFLETDENLVYRASNESACIKLNKPVDYIKLKIKYDVGPDTKQIKIVQGLLEKTFYLKKGKFNEVVIQSNKEDVISIKCEVNGDKYERPVGIYLYEINLIDGNNILRVSMNDVCVENELSEFSFIYNEPNGDDSPQFISNEVINIEIENDSEFQGIVYIGQYGTSGYATAAKGNMYHFFNKGIPISWLPMRFDESRMEDDCKYNVIVKSLINKKIKAYDTVFVHLTADIWDKIVRDHKTLIGSRKVVGYSVWETNKLPYSWVENINNSVSEVWVPSTYNKGVYKNSGVKIPIKVFPHVFLEKTLPDKNKVLLKTYDGGLISNNNCYTFYNISELNIRKGVEDLVKSFCDSFTSNDNVRLILKVHYKNYEESNKKYCIDKLTSITKKYKKPPAILYILDNLDGNQILGLHSIGDCYVSLCKSEGFGLCIFEALKYGKQIITTGYSGPLDFLGKDYEGLVSYKLGNVENMEAFSKFYTNDQQWAIPDLNHAKELMQIVKKL